jgi:hypothetical protein
MSLSSHVSGHFLWCGSSWSFIESGDGSYSFLDAIAANDAESVDEFIRQDDSLVDRQCLVAYHFRKRQDQQISASSTAELVCRVRSPLQLAAQQTSHRVVSLLLRIGADAVAPSDDNVLEVR